MITKPAETGYDFLFENSSWSMQREPIHEWDFGDALTVHAPLKRVNRKPFSSDPSDTFGLYLGEHEGLHAVAVHKLGDLYDFTKVELFDNLDEMKEVWMLDYGL